MISLGLIIVLSDVVLLLFMCLLLGLEKKLQQCSFFLPKI